MFILLYDNDKLIGSLCYFPISKDLHDRIMSADDFYDDIKCPTRKKQDW